MPAPRLPRLTRGSMALVLNAVLALVALGLAFAAPGEGAPKLRLASASGSLSLANSKEGAAVFRAEAMRPGRQASGSVTITNTGTVDAALTLAAEAPADTPGSGGGRLSDRLELLVIDVTSASTPVTVYAGTIEAMAAANVGSLAPGGRRTYLFVARLLPGGSGDNAFQGAALTTGFRWSATGSDSPTVTPTATPSPTTAAGDTATPAPQPRPEQTPPPAGAGVDPSGEVLGAQLFSLPRARRCVSRRRFAIHFRRPDGTAYKSIAVTVNGHTKLRLKGLKARKVKTRVNLRGLPAGTVVVRITAVTTSGRKAVSERTYHTCAAKKFKKKKAKKRRRR